MPHATHTTHHKRTYARYPRDAEDRDDTAPDTRLRVKKRRDMYRTIDVEIHLYRTENLNTQATCGSSSPRDEPCDRVVPHTCRVVCPVWS